jgi:putative MATE family efflux protein
MELTENKYDLTQGVIWKKLLSFFFPIAVGMLFEQLYNAVDAVVVGQFVGTDALAAVGGSPAVILNLVIGFFAGLSSGATVVISQYYGAGDSDGISKSVHTAVAFCLAAGAALTVFGILITPWSLRIVHNPEDIMAYSVQYLKIYYVGTIPLLLFNIGSGILRAVGDSKRPLYYLIFCCILNIFLDLLFVIVFKMAVAGVAWATVIALTVSAVLIVLKLCRRRRPTSSASARSASTAPSSATCCISASPPACRAPCIRSPTSSSRPP